MERGTLTGSPYHIISKILFKRFTTQYPYLNFLQVGILL